MQETLSQQTITSQYIGGYLHIIIPDFSSSTGFISYRISSTKIKGVVNVPTFASLPLIGITETIYIATDTNLQYRWNGTGYETLTIPLTHDAIITALGFTPENIANKSINVSTDGASDIKYASAKAVKTYADNLVVGLLDDRGNYDASSNVFPSTGGSGTSGAILKGDLWYISVPGTLGGQNVYIGYTIRALTDAPAQTSSNWDILNAGIGYIPLNISGASIGATSQSQVFTNGATLSNITLGSVLFAGTNGVITQDNANFFYDLTNHRLGLGTTTPNNTIQVFDLINFDNDYHNTYIGFQAGKNLANGSGYNTYIGYKAGYSQIIITTQQNNVGIGAHSLYYNTTGQDNVAIGALSLQNNTSGNFNIAIGYDSLNNNTTGYANVANGYFALRYNTTGYINVAIGGSSLQTNTIGQQNTAIGGQSLYFNLSGDYNVGVGVNSLYMNSVGNFNVAIGSNALYYALSNYNTAIGDSAGQYIADGSNYNTNPLNCLYLGANTKASADNQTNEIVIGYNAIGLGSNTIVFGNSAITINRFYGNIGLGVNSPSARLMIAAGSATAGTAPIKLIAGSVLIAPENGTIEFDGTHLYFTTSLTRYQIDQQSGTGLATDGSQTGGTAYSQVFTNGVTLTNLTASKVVFTDSLKNLTSAGIGTSSQFIKGDGSLANESNYLLASGARTGAVSQAQVFTNGATLSNITLGSVLFAGTSGAISQDNANFFYDSTNHRLVLGNTSTSYQFEVVHGTTNPVVQISSYSSTAANGAVLNFLHSDSNTIGALVQNAASDILGQINFYGVTTSSSSVMGGYIKYSAQTIAASYITGEFSFFTGAYIGMYLSNNNKLCVSGEGGNAVDNSTFTFSTLGNSVKSIGMERAVGSGIAGFNFAIQAGGAKIGGTNLRGGALIFNDGISTGNSIGTSFQWVTYDQTTSGTSDQTTTVKMTMLNTGNLGLGKSFTAPANLLHIDGGNATATYLQVTNGSTTGQLASNGLIIGIDASGNAVINEQFNGTLKLYTNNTLALTISAAQLATFAGAATITGAATLSSTLNVTGTTTLATSLTGALIGTSGVVSSLTTVTGKISDATTITNITTGGNWTAKVYGGPALSSQWEGTYYSDGTYFYYMYSDNTPIRISLV